MTLKALTDARSLGFKIGTLYASSMGKEMYKKIGFNDYYHCTFSRYVMDVQ